MRALITGITGQDGSYLAHLLLSKGYEVYGLHRRSSSPNTWRLGALGILDQVHLIGGDITDMASIIAAIMQAQPDEIYNLAALSFVGASFSQPLVTSHVDGTGVVMLLEAVKQINPKIKVYHASTSELYGDYVGAEPPPGGLSETSPFHPMSPYAASKLYAYHMVRIYREAYGMFAVNGILFNHESPMRGLEFVTRKITNSLARIKVGVQQKLHLGNLDARRDWGFAPEYVEAMWRMLQQAQPRDLVVATGECHSVREFIKVACARVDLDWEAVVEVKEHLKRPLEVPWLAGNATEAQRLLGWRYQTTFPQLVHIMMDADLQRWQNHLQGKLFHWDANSDPGDRRIPLPPPTGK